MKVSNSKKKWIIIIFSAIIFIVGSVFLYRQNSVRVFTNSEYVKEVIIQNQNFGNILDEFLDKVSNYNGSKQSMEQLESSASKVSDFVSALREKLGPKVPHDSKEHYEKMMKAYDMYVEATNLYKKSLYKNLGQERNEMLGQARDKLSQASEAMKNLDK